MASFSAMRLRALALLLTFSACGGDDDVFLDAGEADAHAPSTAGIDAPRAPLDDAGDGDADVDAGMEPDLCAMEDRDADPRRVFFLGNSFTFTYDLPGLFRQLATAGGVHATDRRLVHDRWPDARRDIARTPRRTPAPRAFRKAGTS
ncbi:MAG: hypothetical protein H6724_00600 [Sandaracinus sp.]|nr:hypothetical protein [Sandaracinus sp.]